MRLSSSRWVWPWPPPRLKDLAALLFIALVLAFVLATYLWFPFSTVEYRRPDLGADWTCAYPGHGEPVCVRNVGAPKARAP